MDTSLIASAQEVAAMAVLLKFAIIPMLKSCLLPYWLTGRKTVAIVWGIGVIICTLWSVFVQNESFVRGIIEGTFASAGALGLHSTVDATNIKALGGDKERL